MHILHVRYPEQTSASMGELLLHMREHFMCGKTFPLRVDGSRGASLLVDREESVQHLSHHLHSLAPRSGDIHVEAFVAPSQVCFDRPLFIIGAPRSGSTLLFETLQNCPDLWTTGGESNEIFEAIFPPSNEHGNRLDENDFSKETFNILASAFLSVVRNSEGRLYLSSQAQSVNSAIRFLEKTPKNTLRVAFLKRAFPNCRFVLLYREPLSNISSLIDGWRTPDRFQSYTINGRPWKFLLPPGWRNLVNRPVAEIAAAQWKAAYEHSLDDLAQIPRSDWLLVKYHDFIKAPEAETRRICDFASLQMTAEFHKSLTQPLPLSQSILEPPRLNKWEKNKEELATVLPSVANIGARIEQL